tara:strand:- start:467 stop:865 length:399 start_codon:yes stop_codon:yes gene_type:complete
MLSRDILEEQELEYALSLIEDMERESNKTDMEPGVSDRTENQVVCRQEEQRETNALDEEEEEEEEEEAEQNPSPRTLREMRRAYFEGLESRRRLASEPVSTIPAQIEREVECSKPAGQTGPPRRRLRSGRSY